MYIRKTKNEYGAFDVAMEEDSKILKIYQSELGLHFSCRFNNFQQFSIINFVIHEKHKDIYPVFSKLYDSLMKLKEHKERIATLLPKMEREALAVATLPIINEKGITIMSDAHPFHSPFVLSIQKRDNRIVLYFINEKKEKEFAQQDKKASQEEKKGEGIMVQINQKDSKLGDFAIPFRILFDSLQEVPNTKLGEEKLRLFFANKNK